MEFFALSIVNFNYGPLSGLGDKEEGLRDCHNIQELFKHTVFKDNYKEMINKSKKEIESELTKIYEIAA